MADKVLTFGDADEPLPELAPFVYYGETIRLADDFGETVFTDWADQFAHIDENSIEGAAAGKTLMRSVVHPDDFEKFWGIVRRRRQGTEDLMRVVQALVEGIAERPTGQPAGSAGGPEPTPRSSGDDSFSRVIDMERSRPDRQLVAYNALKARQAEEERGRLYGVSG